MDLNKLWRMVFTEHPEDAIPWIILGWAFSMALHGPPLFRLFH